MRAFYSPMGDPTLANATVNLASALFPNARAQAAARMAGAQYAGQLAQNEQTGLENVGLQRSNAAFDSLGSVVTDPLMRSVLMTDTTGNSNNLANVIAAFQEQGFRQAARDRAVAGDFGGAVGEQFGLADSPTKINVIDGGYQLNPYQVGGPITATGTALSDIMLNQARAGQAAAAANASNARAARIADEMANPGRYRAPTAAGGVNDISPSEAIALDKMIGNSLPGAIKDVDGGKLEPQIDPGLRDALMVRASELYQQNRNAGASVAQAIAELAEIQQGTPGVDSTFWFDQEGTAPKVTRRNSPDGAPAPAPAPAPAAPTAPGSPYRDGTQLTGPDGKLYVVKGGVPVLVE